MLITDGTGVPVGMLVASAQQAEVRLAEATLATVQVQGQRGRPRTRPQRLVCDRGYDSRRWRQQLRGRGISCCIPPRRLPPPTKRKRRGRPVGYDRAVYARRYIVERSFAWLLANRRIVVRWERRLEGYRGFVLLAMAMICLNRLLQ